MLKNKRLLLIPLILALAAVVVLGMKIAYPAHRLIAYVLLGLGWIPLIISYHINRRILRVQKAAIKNKAKPYRPHVLVAILLLLTYYTAWMLFPVAKSPLADMTPAQIRADLQADLESCLMVLKSADDVVDSLKADGLLQRDVGELSQEERQMLRKLWRDGVMVFMEFDLLKAKYRGFYQIDYLTEPGLHADAFLLAYLAYVAQYNACLHIVELIDDNEFLATLLNEEGAGVPADSYFYMKQRLTHPNVILRLNAAAAYHELIKKDVTLDPSVIAELEARRTSLIKSLGANADLFVENPLEILERAAFETMLPVQESVAVQMSYIRTARRDYLITPEILDAHITRLEPGDILIQRRNWHMTNIGIPGFWPHVALYVGTPEEVETYFQGVGFNPLDAIKPLYPAVYAAWEESDEEGHPMRVIEAIRPGVVMQSLETSARCDYLGVIRPNLTKPEKFKALLTAFSHYGKAYDLNFDFTTDNALVCSELIYKAYRDAGDLPLKTEIINGRRLLPPNRLAEQAVLEMGDDRAFLFVLFLDAVEKDDAVVERKEEAFKKSWQRPKWDVMQQ